MTESNTLCKWDGHTHSPFCRHGDGASLETYVTRAAQLGFTRYSVTEHPPLPRAWLRDAGQMAQLAMTEDELPGYLAAVQAVREKFAPDVDIRIGLELDYLAGAEYFTRDLIERCNGALQDTVVSVHFLPGRGGMRCIDMSPADWVDGLLSYYGSADRVVLEYMEHIGRAVEFAGGLPVPARIGHLTLIEKFRAALPPFDDALLTERLAGLLPLLRQTGVGIDVNVAGLRMPLCRRAYVPEWFVRRAAQEGLALVYGSDAHRPQDVGADWEWYREALTDSTSQRE